MHVTQDYKKVQFSLSEVAAALAGTACIALPFAAFLMGWV